MIVIVGAGPAGISAALRAHECGAAVTLIDDNPAPGGQIWRGETARRQIARLNRPGISVISNSTALSADPVARMLLVETPEGARRVAWDRLILATGSREILLPFPGWTLPGVMGAGGLQAMAKLGLPVAGKKIVIGGSGPLLIAVAVYLRKRGARVSLVAEQASARALVTFSRHLLKSPSKLMTAAALQWRLAGVPYVADCWIEAAQGDTRLQRVVLRKGAKTWTEDCDYVGIGYGLTPNDELATLVGEPVCGGAGGVELSIVEGEIAGLEAAGRAREALALYPRRDQARRFAAAISKAFALRPELKTLATPETLVCRCEDVSYGKLQPYPSFRAAKLHTRCGMGACQGRICGPATELLFGWPAEPARPPVFPARIGTLLPDTNSNDL